MEHSRGYLHPFLNANLYDNGVGEEIRTLVELKMCRLSYYIRSTPSWWIRLLDERGAAVAREEWTTLAQQDTFLLPLEGEEGLDTHTPLSSSLPDPISLVPPTPSSLTLLRNAPSLTESQINWVLDELPTYAKRIALESHCQPSCFERIWEADRAFSPQFLLEISDEIQKRYLDDKATRASCIRPSLRTGQDNTQTILDFTHPSDFPMISNTTLRWHREDDDTSATGTGPRKLAPVMLGRPASAIPTDFYVSENGDSIERLGYINNIPPTIPFARLNELLTRSIQTFIPIFEHTLTSLHRANHILLQPRIVLQEKPSPTFGTSCIQYKRGEDPPDAPGQGVGHGTDDEDDDDLWGDWFVARDMWAQRRTIILPDVPSGGFKGWRSSGRNKDQNDSENAMREVSLKGKRIQVFTKLARLELTPDHPRFNGNQWGCEGSYDDHIVACGSVVLDSHNVTEGSIAFRMAVTRPPISPDDPNSACLAYWGKERSSLLNQEIGSVALRKGRCITYPNIYQHKLSPFELVDRSSPGHRTTLQILLVDPEVPILSSTDIPPQQASWAMQALMDSLNSRVPVEIIQRIVDFAVYDIKCLIPDESRWPLRIWMERCQVFERNRSNMYFEMVF